MTVSLGQENTFKIGVFNFKACSDEDQKDWVNKIRDVINKSNNKVVVWHWAGHSKPIDFANLTESKGKQTAKLQADRTRIEPYRGVLRRGSLHRQ